MVLAEKSLLRMVHSPYYGLNSKKKKKTTEIRTEIRKPSMKEGREGSNGGKNSGKNLNSAIHFGKAFNF